LAGMSQLCLPSEQPAEQGRARGMTSLERHWLALRLQEADRVPVAPSFLTRTVRKLGAKQHAYHNDPQVLADAQIAHCEAYDFDGLYISSDNVIMYEALGGRIIFPDDHSYPFWTDPLISAGADLAKLGVPDPLVAGRMPVIIEATRIAARELGDRRFILTNIDSGPFSLACTLMGMEAALAFLVEEPAEMQEILAFCSEVAIAYGRAVAGCGCHGVQFGESSAVTIGRERYHRLAWPYDRYVVEELKKTGVAVFLHVCGDSSSIIDLMAATGADCLEIDSQVSIAWAKEQTAGRTALKGNVNTVSFLTRSVSEFLGECEQVITQAKPGGGFILCGGCEVPAATNDEIVMAFRRAADLYGRYR